MIAQLPAGVKLFFDMPKKLAFQLQQIGPRPTPIVWKPKSNGGIAMKKSGIFAAAAACCLLLAACMAPEDAGGLPFSAPAASGSVSSAPAQNPTGESSGVTETPASSSASPTTDPPAATTSAPTTVSTRNGPPTGFGTTRSDTNTVVCRIVSGAERGILLLAALKGDGSADSVLRLSVDGLTVEGGPLRDGMTVGVSYNGLVAQSFPAQLGNPTRISVREEAADDRCALYLKALNDLWEEDPALNSGIEIIGLDLSETSLTPSEQLAVGWTFREQHQLDVVRGTMQELQEQGYFQTSENGFTQWEKGCHFSIREEGERNQDKVVFTAQKWRTSLAAYVLADCTASRGADGYWSDYKVGSRMAA